MSKRYDKLLALAREEFNDLTDPEAGLIAAVVSGEIARFEKSAQGPARPGSASDRDEERTIRARLLRWLCINRETIDHIDTRGIFIHSAFIQGKLDFAYVTIPFPLVILRSAMPDGVDLTDAETRLLCFDGSCCSSFVARGLNARGSLFLRNRFRARGQVQIASAEINGNFECSGAHFLSRGEISLAADRVKVGGGVFLDLGFVSYGEISMRGAAIEADLDCRGGQFFNRGRTSLALEGAKIRGNGLFSDGFKTNGVVNLHGGRIGADLNFRGSAFAGADCNGLLAHNATVSGRLQWTGVKITPKTRLDLGLATVGHLMDDEASWPGAGDLILDGLTYSAINLNNADIGMRLRWLERQKPYSPQPYQQLIDVLRREGQTSKVRTVGIAKERALRVHGNLSLAGKFANWLLGVAAGHGYKVYRILAIPAFFVCAGWILFSLGYKEGLIFPSNEAAYRQFKTTRTVPETYPAFGALVYSLDTFLPLTDFHQEDYWHPDPRIKCGNDGGTISCGKWLDWFLGAHILAGWVFAILGATGILTHKD